MDRQFKTAPKLSPPSGDRSIGALLIDTGKLTLDDADRIMRLQKEEGLRFGEAAIRLGLAGQQDIDRALAQQYDYPYLLRDEGTVAEELVAAYDPFCPQVEALRALRSQLMLRWFTGVQERKTLTVVSPGHGEGRSWLAANLAIVFSQLGEHTLLVDADMRQPRQHELFKLDNKSGLSSILSNRGELNEIRRIASFMDLSVLPAGPTPPNPQELLGRSIFAKLLEELASEFDVVIIDTSAGHFADAQTVSARSRGALVAVRQNRTQMRAVSTLTDNLRQHGVSVVGAVLNKF